MGDAYPKLRSQRSVIEHVLRQEEERFAETLDQGMRMLDQAIAGMSGEVIDGETVFRLYDTYGFPVDLTADIARERGLSADVEGFEVQMEAQRNRARASSNFTMAEVESLSIEVESSFIGYESLEGDGQVAALLKDGESVKGLSEGELGVVVLETTPFYAESGGQVGDRGTLKTESGTFNVTDTQKYGSAFAHIGMVKSGNLAIETLFMRRSTPTFVAPPCVITPRLIWCMRLCEKSWASTSCKKVRWSTPSACASISRTMSQCPPSSCTLRH